MQKNNIGLLVILCWGLWLQTAAAENKSQPVRKSWFLVPAAAYQEETSLALGLTGGYYFSSRHLSKISSLSGSLFYTLRNQAKLNLNPRFYFAHNRVLLTGNVQLRYYPNHYFGISSHPTEVDVLYTSRMFRVLVQPTYLFGACGQVGLQVEARGENLLLNREQLPPNAYPYGWDPYFQLGMGFQLACDQRDNMFYPLHFCHFAKLSCMAYSKALASTYSFASIKLDVRQYVPVWRGQMFAWQFCFDTRLGKEVPFEMLPTLGGSDILRGFRENKLVGNTLWCVQAEYRIPIYSRLKGAVFGSVGDVMDIYHPSCGKVKVGYGLGLRCRLNEARVNLRFDVAANNYGEFKFYITATEAF